MAQVKGSYGYDTWMDLTQKRPKLDAAKTAADPSAGLMDMMKDLYEDGDDNMRKAMGEAMMKSRQDQMAGKSAFDDAGFESASDFK